MIYLGPYTPVITAIFFFFFFFGAEGVEGGEHVWEVGGDFFVFEEAGEMEDMGAGEGYEDIFVWRRKKEERALVRS